MRFSVAFGFLFTFLAVSPALAGSMDFVDGQGTWRSSSCQTPAHPAKAPVDSEASADDLNARHVAQSAYVEALEVYMQCLSREAERDAAAASRLIIEAARAEILRARNAAP